MDENYYAVIMAGGGGTRMWPLSRQSSPKQILKIIGDTSLFQDAVERLGGIFPPERILVVTIQEQAPLLQDQRPEIPLENFLIEPLPRGTASVVGMAAIAIQERDPKGIMAVVTADHFIGNTELFHRLLMAAKDVAMNDYLVTLGITPSFPSTGYGYIQSGETIGFYNRLEVNRVVRFTEKPDQSQAINMVEAGDHVWNSGMFVWKVERILDEINQQMPALSQTLVEISKAWNTSEKDSVVTHLWPGLKPETIDYGVMEHASKVAVIQAKGLDWSDVGSWDALFGLLPTDENGNIVRTDNYIGIDTRDSLIYLDGDKSERLIVSIGLDEIILVDTEDVLLICPKDRAQEVREVVKRLKQIGQKYY